MVVIYKKCSIGPVIVIYRLMDFKNEGKKRFNFSHIKHMGIYLLFQYFFKSLLIPHK